MRSVRTFLCYRSENTELEEGRSLLVGRGAHCDIVLEDDLASREHYRVWLTAGVVTVEDLDSHNGVLVNGLAIRHTQVLHHGDHVVAGRSPVSILQQVHEPRTRQSHRPSGAPEWNKWGEWSTDGVTHSGSLDVLLGGSAQRALEAGDLTSAEGSGRSFFVELRGRVARGRVVTAEQLARATDLALELAEATHDPVWIERSLELLVSAARPMSAAQAERVNLLGERLTLPQKSLRAYLQMARANPDDESAPVLG